jgi:Domain of unknown function (DUF4062)
MKIFISSLIRDFEPFRVAARAAVKTLRHEAIMAEDFAAQPNSPQIACLKGLREADLVVLILGARYGAVQNPSGLSPTHEEYLEARGKKPILAFVQNGVPREDKQAALVSDVQAWDSGLFRSGFDDTNDLQEQIIRAIHEYQLAHAAAPLDVALLEQKSKQLLAQQSRRESSGTPFLKLAMVSGPIQQILRPAKLENETLKETLHQHALFGQDRLFNPSAGVSDGIDDAALFLEQKGGSRIQLDEQGALLFRQPVDQAKSRERSGFMLAIIEETVLDQLNRVIGYASWVLDQIDATQRLTHVGIAATIEGSNYLGWRTQAEQDASPNSGHVRMNTGDSRLPVCVNWPRAAMRFGRQELAEDLMVRLRRQYRD